MTFPSGSLCRFSFCDTSLLNGGLRSDAFCHLVATTSSLQLSLSYPLSCLSRRTPIAPRQFESEASMNDNTNPRTRSFRTSLVQRLSFPICPTIDDSGCASAILLHDTVGCSEHLPLCFCRCAEPRGAGSLSVDLFEESAPPVLQRGTSKDSASSRT